MHELGVLVEAVKLVNKVAEKNNIGQVKYMTLAVGEDSGYLPVFFRKLFPVAIENFSAVKNAELRIEMVSGNGLLVKDIGY